MPLDDPNDPQQPEAPPEPAPAPQEPEPPQIDVNQAYEVIAQAEGWDPRLTRYEIQEHKRRVEQFERDRKEWERERERTRYQPPEDNSDPYMRELRETRRMIQEDREERRKERENQELVTRLGNDLHSVYTSQSRQAGMTKEQMEAQSEEFYAILTDLYPAPGMLQEMGVERAARNAFRLLQQQSNGRPSYRPQVNGRGPTATRTIPGSPQPYTPAGNPMPQEESLSAEQLQGETDEQYRDRLQRIIDGAGLRRLPEGHYRSR